MSPRKISLRYPYLPTIAACLALMALVCGCVSQEGDALAEPTESEPSQSPKHSNRLARETSPYLLLHAHNPVDWYPWGPEALAKAKEEGKPIFLSIGYSSCYWCHVMERNVFSDPEIAKYMNEHFVNVKVDREERPDIDEIYMTALIVYFRAVGSRQTGGWPLSLFLTPAGKPLGGGTYFPPKDTEERDGFPTLMKKVHDAWIGSRKEMEQNADFLARGVQASLRPRIALKPTELKLDLVTSTTRSLQATFDPDYGGFDYDPNDPEQAKFPVPSKLALLQYDVRRHGSEDAEEMVTLTLDNLAGGGIHDQLGGGFHRYSTDRFWRVPHFEKMLYDNALLADVFVEGFRQTRNPRYREVAEGIFDFVLRDLTDRNGGFYSALDAETDGIEGKYYVWDREEVRRALSPTEYDLCAARFGLERAPNFEDRYVLVIQKSDSELMQDFRLNRGELEQQWQTIRTKLLGLRRQRKPVLRDDKVLTAWNGLMIRAFATGGVVLNRPDYLNAAKKAAFFIVSEMRDEEGDLLRTWRGGKAHIKGYLDDYAFMVEGLLALHQATGEQKWLNAAVRLTDRQIELFWDERNKGCYFTGTNHEELLARTRGAHDSVLPSGNSITVRNMVRIASLLNEPKYREFAEQSLQAFAPMLEANPRSHCTLALALGEFLDNPNFGRPAQPPAENQPPAEAEANAPSVRPLGDAFAGPAEKPEFSEVDPMEADLDGGIRQTNNETPQKKKLPEHVKGEVYLSVDRLPPGSRCHVLVRLLIEDPWHINANPPIDEFAVATEVEMVSKFDAELTDIRYPAAIKLVDKTLDSTMLVYEKQAILRGVIDVPIEAAGRQEELVFQIRYQACNEKTCLRPQVLTLTVPIDVARLGEQVKPINQRLFVPRKPAP